jgi:hypothetical protein
MLGHESDHYLLPTNSLADLDSDSKPLHWRYPWFSLLRDFLLCSLHPLDGDLKQLEPVVFTPDAIFARAGSNPDPQIQFITATRRVIRMRPLLPTAQLAHLAALRVVNTLRGHLESPFTPNSDSQFDRMLEYFVDHLAPAFLAIDWSRQTQLPDPRSLDDPHPWFSPDFLGSIPRPVIPIPSALWKGNLYPLTQSASGPRPPRNAFKVIWNHNILTPGDPHNGEIAVSHWQNQLGAWFDSLRTDLSSQRSPKSPAVASARASIHSQGYYETGDLVIIKDPRPMIGHIIPDHHNLALLRTVGRDLALTLPMSFPFRPHYPTVIERANHWKPLNLRYGLCLGNGGPVFQQDRSGLRALAFLRWGCIQIATSRAFHINDLRDATPRDRGVPPL